MLANARPFSFQEAVKKKPPPSEPDLQVVFRATPVPKAVHEPLWEIIQHREAGRQERVAREAQALYQKRQLSNKDSAREEERHISPTSPLYLPYISQGQRSRGGVAG